MSTLRLTQAAVLATSMTLLAAAPAHAVQVFQAAGNTPADLLTSINSFRSALGGANNGAAAGTNSGRREINWDGAPDAGSDPTFMSPTAFRNSRGATFTTPGEGTKIGADSANPTNTPANFGFAEFMPFSAQRLFAPIGSTLTITTFTVAGNAAQLAEVSGFGAVFTGVDDAQGSWVSAYDAQGGLLGSVLAPAGTLSFAALYFDGGQRIAEVRINSGTQAIGTLGAGDYVATDDFIFGEPVAAVPEPTSALLLALGLGAVGLRLRRRVA